MESGLRAFSAGTIIGVKKSSVAGPLLASSTPRPAYHGRRTIACRCKARLMLVAWCTQIAVFAPCGRALISEVRARISATRDLNPLQPTSRTALFPILRLQLSSRWTVLRQRQVWLEILSLGHDTPPLTTPSGRRLDC